MVKLWVVVLVGVVTCVFASGILQVVAFLTLLTSEAIIMYLAYFDLTKKKIQAEQKRKDPMSAKNRDPIWLLAQMEGKLLTVQSGTIEQPHTKVENNWYMSVQVGTFEFEGETYQIVAVKPDPYYHRLIGGAMPRLQA